MRGWEEINMTRCVSVCDVATTSSTIVITSVDCVVFFFLIKGN